MCFLHNRIGMGQRGAWFTQPETELPEHTLALPNPNGNAVPLLNPGTECFPIPEVSTQTNLPGVGGAKVDPSPPVVFPSSVGDRDVRCWCAGISITSSSESSICSSKHLSAHGHRSRVQSRRARTH